VVSLGKSKITKWSKVLVDKYENLEWENASKFTWN
jgi:hypothetical protein